MLDRLEATYSGQAVRKGLSLRLPPASAWVSSDAVLLERILGNLISNAVRYTCRGGVVVLCRRRGEALRIEVVDSGPGIPADRLESIFSEFVRLEPTNDEEKQGLGLGLAIVERLARLLGHPIEVRSVVGRGSRFSIAVPLSSAPEIERSASEGLALPDQSADGRLIVLVDDDRSVRESMGGLLSSWGYQVIEAPSTEEALVALGLRQDTPALVISDYELGDGTTGIDCISALRGSCDRLVPAFLITGGSGDGSRQAGIEVLKRPLTPAALREALQRHLKADAGA
jgi:CheY-like chemotaxis protein